MYVMWNDLIDFINSQKQEKCVPAPGIEPGPPGWKPGILTTRPRRRTDKVSIYSVYKADTLNVSSGVSK